MRLSRPGEIAAVQVKVAAGEEPWRGAYVNMLADAALALGQVPRSVVDNGAGVGGGGNPHRFSTDAIKDGRWGSRADYEAASAMSRALVNLGLGYAFTGEARYAEKALDLLQHWCLDPATFMEPRNRSFSPHTAEWRRQWAIEIMITVPGMIHGADLVWSYPGWKPAAREGVARWFREVAGDARSQDGGYYNNGENWRVLLLAATGALLEDPGLLDHAAARYRNAFGGLLSGGRTGQMNLDGSLKYEVVRPTGLDYSNFALLPMILTAEVARHAGQDLYGFRLPDGRGLEKGLDFMAPFTENPASWPFKQDPDYRGEQAGLFELAYLWKGKAGYLAAVERWRRPLREQWVLGHPSLTHAAGAYPFRRAPFRMATEKPVDPVPPAQPQGVRVRIR